MKAIQVMFEDDFPADIDAQYERAYAGVEDPLGQDFEGWENEGASFSDDAFTDGRGSGEAPLVGAGT